MTILKMMLMMISKNRNNTFAFLEVNEDVRQS